MKILWKIIIILVIVGLILASIGLITGASRTLYLDKKGVHIGSDSLSVVMESDLAPVHSIYIDVRFSDVEFVNSNEFTGSEMYGIDLVGKDMEWLWTLENGVLSIACNRSVKLQILSFDFFDGYRDRVRIILPSNVELDVVSIKTGSGNINIGGFQANRTEINNSFGNVDINSITSSNMQLELSSGRFTGLSLNTQSLIFNNRFGNSLFQALVADSIQAESSSGDMAFRNCEFGYAEISNSFGKINATGMVSSDSTITAKSGDININGDLTGNTVIHSDFGNVDLTLPYSKTNYSYNISVSFGKITFDGERMKDQTTLTSGAPLENHLNLSAKSGDISVSFKG